MSHVWIYAPRPAGQHGPSQTSTGRLVTFQERPDETFSLTKKKREHFIRVPIGLKTNGSNWLHPR